MRKRSEMDTTYDYIEMCRKAFKHLGMPSYYRTPYYNTKDNSIMQLPYLKECIPIYTQDQLQDMVERSLSVKSNGNHMAVQFAYFVSDHIENHIHFGDVLLQSMEQLWLAFVMHEKYGKKWDGQDWVKETPGKE